MVSSGRFGVSNPSADPDKSLVINHLVSFGNPSATNYETEVSYGYFAPLFFRYYSNVGITEFTGFDSVQSRTKPYATRH